MSLDGLRAWIGEVERKLGMRTRVFLVLATIAIGGAGAAVYLAIDTRENAVSESDVQALQEKLEARIRAVAVGAAAAAPEPEAAAPEVESEGVPPASEGAPKSGGGAGTESGGGETQNGASGGVHEGAGKSGAASSKIQELLERNKEANEKAEREIEAQP